VSRRAAARRARRTRKETSQPDSWSPLPPGCRRGLGRAGRPGGHRAAFASRTPRLHDRASHPPLPQPERKPKHPIPVPTEMKAILAWQDAGLPERDGQKASVNDMAVSPTGELLVVAASNAVLVYDVATGALPRYIPALSNPPALTHPPLLRRPAEPAARPQGHGVHGVVLARRRAVRLGRARQASDHLDQEG